MTQALVIGQGGIGAAVAEVLRGQGHAVTAISRATGFDLMDPRSLAGVTGPFDLIFVATGMLAPDGSTPEKSLAAIEPEAMAEVFAVNTIGPALILSQVSRLLPKDRRAVVAVLSARVGSIGDNNLGGWHSYRASKAAVNQIIRGAAIELTRTRPKAICVALHPGTVDTGFTANYAAPKQTPAQAAGGLLSVMDGLSTDQTGGFFDYAGAPIPW